LLGLQVLGVTNGRDAVDLALSALRAGHPFDLILMDLEMPILDGYEAIRRVREGGFTGPILALTAHSGDDSLLDCLRIGCDDCLCKPFNWVQLRELIQRFLPGFSSPGTILSPDE
jgi:CheY-like chemotaxis protein